MIPVVQGIVDWIEAHIFDTLSVERDCEKVRLLTLVLLQRQFAMVTGCTLASYVSRRKMTIATIYLTQTQASIQSISSARIRGDKPLSAGPFTVTLACRRPAIVVIRRAKRAICNIPCGWGMEIEQERAWPQRRSGRPGSANGFRRHDATSADIMANPVILAQGVWI